MVIVAASDARMKTNEVNTYQCEFESNLVANVSSGDCCGSEFIGTVNVGAEPEERTGENRKEEQENEEDGRTQICIRVHVYIYVWSYTKKRKDPRGKRRKSPNDESMA
jgi:hypothetical protein